ncbi:MAG TPA: universal stress protein [Acidimicrobiales bacterium]
MFDRILLALDNAESGDTAVSFTSALARRLDSEVRVVHVNELLVGGRGYAAETELEAMNVVDTATARLRGAGVPADGVHYLANCFTIDSRIAESALEWGADVIVFGSKRRRLLPRFGTGMRERVTVLTGLPTLTAPAPLKFGRKVSHRLELASRVPEETVVS